MGKGGPKTAQGKAAVARNAVTHGLLSAAPIAATMERSSDWETHLVGTAASLGAAGHIEVVLAERIAALLWRLGRVARYEAETIQQGQDAVEADIAKRRRNAANLRGERADYADPADARDAVADARRLRRLLRRFPSMPDAQRMSGGSAAAILYAVGQRAAVDVDDMELPGVPDDMLIETAPGWSADRVRQCISAIASESKRRPDELLDSAQEQARRDEIRARHRLENIEREILALRRERLLPDTPTLEKVSRYEAHLSRQMVSALHELEVLQSRRQGHPAPLARLDVSGLPTA